MGSNTMVDDVELLHRYAEEGSEAAFAELVTRHVDLVYSAALRRVGGDAHAAADVTQQVFAALARQSRRLARDAVLAGWLYATTRNVAVDFVRAEQRRRRREGEAQAMQELAAHDPAVDWSRLRPLLDGAMDELNDADREAVLLRFFARRSFAEIAAALRVSEDAARMRVERALEKLRARLSRRGVTSTAAGLSLALTGHAVGAAPAGLAAAVAGSTATGAGAAAGAGWFFFNLMNASKITVGVVGALTVLAVGSGWQEARAARAEASALQAGLARRDGFAASLARLQSRVTAAEQVSAGLRAAAEERPRPPAPAAPRAPTAQDALKKVGEAFLEKHPELRQAIGDWERARVADRHAGFYRSTALTAAQRARFEELMTAGLGMNTSGFNMPAMFLAAGPEEMPVAEKERQLRELLGAQAYAELGEFNRLNGARQMTRELAAALHATPAPLTTPQAAQLLPLFVDPPNDGATATARDWERILAYAATILNASQLESLRAMRDTDRFNQEIRRARQASRDDSMPATAAAAKPTP